MNNILDLLLYRHRRFKGESYFKNHFPFMLIISMIFSIFLADSLTDFAFIVLFFIVIDMLLAFAAWLYYPTKL
jgi:uncharacterized membrane protein